MESGHSTCRHMLEPVRPEAVLPDRALCLPTFSHFFIVNKSSLSLCTRGPWIFGLATSHPAPEAVCCATREREWRIGQATVARGPTLTSLGCALDPLTIMSLGQGVVIRFTPVLYYE